MSRKEVCYHRSKPVLHFFINIFSLLDNLSNSQFVTKWNCYHHSTSIANKERIS